MEMYDRLKTQRLHTLNGKQDSSTDMRCTRASDRAFSSFISLVNLSNFSCRCVGPKWSGSNSETTGAKSETDYHTFSPHFISHLELSLRRPLFCQQNKLPAHVVQRKVRQEEVAALFTTRGGGQVI